MKDLCRRGRVYLGFVVEKRGLRERPGRHEPILDAETYGAGMAAIRARKRAGHPARPHRVYLLSGVLHCSCGARMRGETRVSRGKEWRYYGCPVALGRSALHDEAGQLLSCSAGFVPAERAEAAVLGAIASMVLPGAVIDAAREELRRRLDVPSDDVIGAQRRRLQTRMEQLRKQHEWGDIADEEYRSARDDTHRQLGALPDGDKLVAFDRARRVMTSMAENLAAATPAQRRELVALLVQRAMAQERQVDPAAITWTPPARPFFAGSCECVGMAPPDGAEPLAAYG